MVKTTAIRDAYGQALKALGEEDRKVVALEADVGGSTKSALFGKAFPERYFEVGISEMNMVNMAAGMARGGLIPFCNSFSAFLSTRGADPIFSMIAYDRLNVKLAGTYIGLSDSYDGASHQAICDAAYLRSVPGLVVITPSDPVMTQKAVFAAAKHKGPVYLRLSRAPAVHFYDEKTVFSIGKGIRVLWGTDITIISTGTLLLRAIEAAGILAKEGIRAEVIDMPTLSPIDRELIAESARKTRAVVTFEEHSLRGGLFSAVCEVLSRECPVPADGIGAEGYAESGDYSELLEKYGFTAENLARKARTVFNRKKKR